MSIWSIEDPQALGADAGRCSLLQAAGTGRRWPTIRGPLVVRAIIFRTKDGATGCCGGVTAPQWDVRDLPQKASGIEDCRVGKKLTDGSEV